MNNKKALVITYHVKNCKRVGGFHRFIKYLEDMRYDVDWVTSPVSITWLFKKNDRENAKNFIDLCKGIEYDENGVHVRHFAQPVWIPAKIAKKIGAELGKHYWPAWSKLKKKLYSYYDFILVEGVGCQYVDDLKRDYPETKVVYRPSDILETFSDAEDAVDIELNMAQKADLTLCVDEPEVLYFEKRLGGEGHIRILRNPISTDDDIKNLKAYIPKVNAAKRVVYVGVSFVDLDCIEYAAQCNGDAEFVIIGPINRKSHDNVVYMGALNQEEYLSYIRESSVGISPVKKDDSSNAEIIYGYTGKIIKYMSCLLSIVTTRGSNYLNLPGFYNAESKEEFSDYIKQALNISSEERMSYKEPYLEAIKLFSERKCKEEFRKIVTE